MPFNYAEYQAKTSTMSTDQLQKEWENYTRQIAGGATSTATSVLFSPLTAGISLMGLGLSAPRIHNARKKREIIEKGLQERGSTHNTRGRDVAGSMALSGAISVATLGLAGPLADAAAGEAVGKGAEYAVAHLALDGVGEAIEHKHGGHLKKKAEQDLKMKAMQAQLAQLNGGQQQMMMNGQMQMINGQMVMVNGQMVYQGTPMMSGFQQPSLPAGMGLPQAGILMQNQQQIQWQQPNPSLQLPGTQEHQTQFGGLQPGVAPPLRPHSAAPDNQYGQYANIQQSQQQYVQPPQYQQVQDSKFILNVVPDHQQPQMTPNGYVNEKSAAYTTEHVQGNMTPLPLYSQQPGQDGNQHPSHIDLPPAMSMEEEITLLKAKLLQMELEKRGMSATISGPLEISLDPPKPKEVEEQAEPVVAVAEVSTTTEIIPPPHLEGNSDQIKHPEQSHTETHIQTQTQIIAAVGQPADKSADVSHMPGKSVTAPTIMSQSTPPAAQPQVQQYSQVQQVSTQPQDTYQAPQVQQFTPAPLQSRQRQDSLATPSHSMGQPISPVPQSYTPAPQSYTPAPPPQVTQYTPQPLQNAPLYQPQPINPSLQSQQTLPPPPPLPSQQMQQPQYAQIHAPPTPLQAPQHQQYSSTAQPLQSQNVACPPGQIQRQDSGYYSQATTPMQRPFSSISNVSSVSSISSPVNRHGSFSSYNPQIQQAAGGYNPQIHGRSGSMASISSPPPPPYFAPPPGSQQPALAGKTPDYFNQAPQIPMQMQQPQMGVQYGQVQQGWGQGQMMMGQPGMMMPAQQQVVQGGVEPNYGPPPAIPQRM